MNTTTPRLGVDFGRVIQGCALPSGATDTVFLSGGHDAAMRSPATEGALATLARLVPLFAGQVWVISKCGDRIQRRTLDWLAHNDFYPKTGVPPGNVRFCRRRADKAGHCTDLGITHMIDDRLDVHHALRDVVPHRYLFGPQPAPPPPWVHHVRTWTEAEAAITGTLAPTAPLSPAPPMP